MATAVLLSGGVDSSVALGLCRERGVEDITCFYLKIWLEDDLAFLGRCPWEEDLSFARKVCDRFGVPLEVVPLQREYFDRVVRYTLDELRAGRTPSPDIFCNQRVKFGAFLEAVGDSFDRVVTGHYGRVEERADRRALLRAVDPVKDQTYFLSHLRADQVGRTELPLGGFEKREVRDLARRFGLPNHDRRDSQGICFLGKLRFDDFVRANLGERPGEIREAETGRRLGEHRGHWFHTIGQRRGLKLGEGPWFVVAKDIERNVVLVSHQERLSEHGRRAFRVEDAHWIHAPPATSELLVRVRHSPQIDHARLRPLGEGAFEVEIDRADTGLAPGQFAVFYDGDECIGGARIA